jgi:hypothetical protein
VYQTAKDSAKHDLAEKYQKDAKVSNYKDDYVAVNEHDGLDIVPVFNNLMMISDMRSYEIQQIDYADRFRVFNNLGENIEDFCLFSKTINKIEELSLFTDKMKYIYSLDFGSDFMKLILDNLSDSSYAKYYYSIPKERAGTLNYQKGNLEKEYNSLKSFSVNVDSILNEIKNKFQVGNKYTKSDIKEILRSIYESNGYSKTPKASDLEEYFDVSKCQITNRETGKRDHGFLIIKLKT